MNAKKMANYNNNVKAKEKSRLVNIWDDSDGFDFLGLHHRKFPIRKKGRRTFFIMNHIPSKKAMKKMRKKIKDYTEPRSKLFMDIKDLVKGLNRKTSRIQELLSTFSIIQEVVKSH